MKKDKRENLNSPNESYKKKFFSKLISFCLATIILAANLNLELVLAQEATPLDANSISQDEKQKAKSKKRRKRRKNDKAFPEQNQEENKEESSQGENHQEKTGEKEESSPGEKTEDETNADNEPSEEENEAEGNEAGQKEEIDQDAKNNLIEKIQSKDLFQYVPGELIVKLKESPSPSLKRSGNKAQIKNTISIQKVLKSVDFDLEPVLPALQNQISAIKKRSASVSHTTRRKVEQAQARGLDQVYLLKSNSLRSKTLKLIEQINEAKKKSPQTQLITVYDSHYGELRFDLQDEKVKDRLDPYTEEIIETLKKEDNFAYVELNRLVYLNNSNIPTTPPNDPLLNRQWSLDNQGQSFLATKKGPGNMPLPLVTKAGLQDEDINFLETWANSLYGRGRGVVVGVIDSGLDYTHEDIDDNLWINQGEIPGRDDQNTTCAEGNLFQCLDANQDKQVSSREILNYFSTLENGGDLNQNGLVDFKDVLHAQSPLIDSLDNDQNGYTDDLIGWDFVDNENDEDSSDIYRPESFTWYDYKDEYTDNNPYDWGGHGTHVSGTIAAETDNQIGIAGVAPEAKIMSARIFGYEGAASLEKVVQAVYYCAQNGAHITNNSWGGMFSSDTLTDAFHYADSVDSVAVAAAGNDSMDAKHHTPSNIDTVI